MRFVFYTSGAFVLAIGALSFFPPPFLAVQYERPSESVTQIAQSLSEDIAGVVEEVDARKTVDHVPLPESVRAIYMTACVVGTPSFRDELVALIERTELNAVIIDIKDFSGSLSFKPEDPQLMFAWESAKCGARDMEAFIASLHAKGIYVMGRITVFQDPLATARFPDRAVRRLSDGAIWHDHKGLSFVDVSARDQWEYMIQIAKESYAVGFDELNFDYVRFPSDGNMRDINFPHTKDVSKPEALERFFAHLHAELSKPEHFAAKRHVNTGRDIAIPYLSVDLFGMTATNRDDLGIGQILERALPYFDFIAPMVYPSHYPHGFMGLGNPNEYPYQIIHSAMLESARRTIATTTPLAGLTHERIGTTTPAVYAKSAYDRQKIRPWLQDFDYGGDYGPEEVRAQIQATYDAGLKSWMLWAPSNRYTEAALLRE